MSSHSSRRRSTRSAPATWSWWPSGTGATRRMLDGVAHHRAYRLTWRIAEGARPIPPRSDHSDRPRLHRVPERPGGGRAPTHRQARERWPCGRPKRGVRFGRKPKLNVHQQQEVRRRLADGKRSRHRPDLCRPPRNGLAAARRRHRISAAANDRRRGERFPFNARRLSGWEQTWSRQAASVCARGRNRYRDSPLRGVPC